MGPSTERLSLQPYHARRSFHCRLDASVVDRRRRNGTGVARVGEAAGCEFVLRDFKEPHPEATRVKAAVDT